MFGFRDSRCARTYPVDAFRAGRCARTHRVDAFMLCVNGFA